MGLFSIIPNFTDAPFVKLRKDFGDLLDRNYSAAVVLGCMEFFTNSDRVRVGADKDDLWIPVPLSHFQKYGVLLSRRTIQRAIDVLVGLELIYLRRAHIGAVNEYRLNWRTLNEHLRKGTVFKKSLQVYVVKKEATGDILSHGLPCDKMSPVHVTKCHLSDPVLNLKVLEEEEEEENPIVPFENSSQNNTSELDLEDSTEKFVVNAYRRENRKAAIQRLTTKSAAPLVQKLREKERSLGVEEFRRGLLGFLRDQSDWCRENQWPIAAYLKNPERWVAAYVAPVPAEADPARPAILEGVGATSVPPGPPRLVVADLIAKWNSVIPSSPVEAWDDRLDLTPGVRRSLEDPKFAECFDIVCQKVAAIKSDRDDAGWLTFRWLFTTKEGKPFGWWRVRCGDMDWKPRQSAAESSMNSGMAYAARLRAEIALEKKQRESHT